MTVHRHEPTEPAIARTFTAVRKALPAESTAAFDAEFEAIIHAPVVDLAALDDFLTGWWRIATRAARHPDDWRLMRTEAEQITAETRTAGPTLSEVLARRRIQL